LKIAIQAGWDDVAHLTEKAKRDMLAAIPPWQRDARSKGYPDLGAGAIYPISQEDYITDRVPDPLWPRAYGFDVGWAESAAVWIAFDLANSFAIAYDEYFRGQAEPAIHAAAIRAKGDWISGAIDPASAGSSQLDGSKLIEVYAELGLHITPADNSVTAGITKTWNLLSTGQLKIARQCAHLLKQLKLYRRDEKGRIVKRNDHGCDALRYDVMTGPLIMRTPPAKRNVSDWFGPGTLAGAGGWAG
jgi:hypothetical protein